MKEKLLLAAITLIALIGFSYAAMVDRTNTIIYNMKPNVYYLIKKKGFSKDCDIANEYMKNKTEYDILAEKNLW